MASKGQLTGMQGVYLVAAELSKRRFIASPTSRSVAGADLLVTDQTCQKAFSVQVKTNAKTFGCWLLTQRAKELRSPTHVYVFVNLRKGGSEIEYFIVPSRVVAENVYRSKSSTGTVWYAISIEDVKRYRDKWSVFGRAEE